MSLLFYIFYNFKVNNILSVKISSLCQIRRSFKTDDSHQSSRHRASHLLSFLRLVEAQMVLLGLEDVRVGLLSLEALRGPAREGVGDVVGDLAARGEAATGSDGRVTASDARAHVAHALEPRPKKYDLLTPLTL